MPDVDLDGFDTGDDLDFLDEVAADVIDDDLDFLDSVSDTSAKTDQIATGNSDLDFLDSIIEESSLSEDALMPEMPDFDEIPDFEEEDEIQEIIITQETAVFEFKSQLKLMFPQWIYWSIVFTLLSFASLDLTNPNFNPKEMMYEIDYSYRTIFMLYAWITYLPMGFYYRFSLEKKQIESKMKYLTIFLLGQIIIIGIISLLGIILLNPNYFQGNYFNPNNFMLVYFIFLFQNFIISVISFGFIGIIIGYKYIYSFIYTFTPASEIQSSN